MIYLLQKKNIDALRISIIDRANKKEAAKWFHDFHAVMDKHNIGRCVWTYKQMDFEIDEDF